MAITVLADVMRELAARYPQLLAHLEACPGEAPAVGPEPAPAPCPAPARIRHRQPMLPFAREQRPVRQDLRRHRRRRDRAGV
jgi:hypothetical protein